MKRHDGASLEEIEMCYRARFDKFGRVATAITGSDETGLDAVQESFARAVRERETFRGEGPIEAWLWRIVVNTALNARAGERETVELTSETPERPNGRPDDVVDSVRAVIALLPEQQRLALFLRYYADLDYRTIAEALGVAPGTVGATLNAARASVVRLLEEVAR